MYPTIPDDDFKDYVYQELSTLGKAFASPQRLVIMNIICQGEHTVEALAKHAQLSVANVSRHLQVLRSANLLRMRREGKYIYYRLADEKTAEFFICYRDFSLSRLSDLQASLEKVASAPTRSDRVGMKELFEKLQDDTLYVLDVRPEEEYFESHLPGAVSIPLEEVGSRLQELPKDKEIVVYCRGELCVLADKALSILRSNGFQAKRLNEGLIDWKLAGFPVS